MGLHSFFTELMLELNRTFFLACKRFETQFAYYPVGGYYKKHLDQLADNKHRQGTVILYLEDCLGGGELIIYNKDHINQIDQVYSPRKGDLVIFFSSQIFHEVKEAHSERTSLTTWFRDDEIIPLF